MLILVIHLILCYSVPIVQNEMTKYIEQSTIIGVSKLQPVGWTQPLRPSHLAHGPMESLIMPCLGVDMIGRPDNPVPDRVFFKNPVPAKFVLKIRPSTRFSRILFRTVTVSRECQN